MDSGRSLGGIGALLLVIGTFVPFLSIVGIILLLMGIKNLADYYKDNNIYQDALYAVIFGIIGIVAVGVALISVFTAGAFFGTAGFLGFGIALIIGLVIAFVFYILMAMYFRKAFDALADKTGQGMFRTAGTLLLIGAILTIIFVGLILIFIAWILVTVAFFSIQTTTTPQTPPPPPPAPP